MRRSFFRRVIPVLIGPAMVLCGVGPRPCFALFFHKTYYTKTTTKTVTHGRPPAAPVAAAATPIAPAYAPMAPVYAQWLRSTLPCTRLMSR